MRHVAYAFATALLLGAVPAGAADTAATGELWEVTSRMTMEGMPPGYEMPARTQQLCADKEWKKPPVAADEQQKCSMADWKTSGSTSTWKMHCAGPPAMDGNGEITRTAPDAYKGFMKMSSEMGAITINMSGKKVGDCDAQAAKADREAQIARIEAQAAAGQKAAEDAKRQMCSAPVESLNVVYLNQMASQCGGPSYKAAFCDKVRTQEGFEKTCVREKSDPANALTALAAYCAADAAELAKLGCEELKKTEKDLEVIAACCPEVAKGIAQRECAGRTFTAMAGSKYASLCTAFAKDVMAGGASAPNPTPTPSPDSSTQKAKKKLKSLFGK